VQDDLPENSVALLYDPVQTAMGSLTIKAYRHIYHPTTAEEAQVTHTPRYLLKHDSVTRIIPWLDREHCHVI
jgi:hypothetical protein